MICSEKELGLGEDQSGIMVLPEDSPIGKKLEDYLDFDAILDVSLQPNRPDCTGVVGLAREVAAATDKEFQLPNVRIAEDEKERIEEIVEIEVKDSDLCPRYIARAVRGLKVGPSPAWMQKRLSASGVRPINNLVDISNYVMLEYGQPLHFFDLSKIGKDGGKAKIIVRKAGDENIKTLDGMDRKLTPDILVIADTKGPIAIAGIMGGAGSEIDDNTVDVLIEAAVFDKTAIRRTSKQIGLRSEAVSRFEKGLPLKLPEVAIDRAAQLLSDLADGQVVSGKIDKLSNWIWIQHIGLSVRKVREVLGLKISEGQIVKTLNLLGFEAEKFDIVGEAKKHLGKPYLFGANYKENGTTAFDCSYLTDYIYSLIGEHIGHTSLGQLHHGWEVEVKDLRPGDILFYKGKIDKSVVDEYYVTDDKGRKIKMKTDKYPSGVGHNGLYIGGGQVIHASIYDYDEMNKKWVKKEDEKDHNVHPDPVEKFTKNPEFVGARRYVENLDDMIAVTVPWWRPDVKEEDDLYEEIARIVGYDKIPATLPSQGGIFPADNASYRFTQEVKKFLASIGLTEIASYSFVSQKEIEETIGKDQAIEVLNPLVKDRKMLRPTLIPQMLEALADNQYYKDSLAFFEISRVFTVKKNGNLPNEEKKLAIGIIGGDSYPYHFREGTEYYQLKGYLDALFARLRIKAEYRAKKFALSQIERGAEVIADGQSVGCICQVSDSVANFFNLKKRTAVLEVDLDKIEKIEPKTILFEEINKFPSVTRDLSAVFPTAVFSDRIVEEVATIGNPLKSVSIKDIYEGKPLGKQEKSITVRLVIADSRKTLTDEEVEKVVSTCQNKIEKIGGKIRSGGDK